MFKRIVNWFAPPPPWRVPLLIQRASQQSDRVAIAESNGTYSYQELLDASHRVASCLLGKADDLGEARVAFMVPPGFAYAAIQWGIWRAGGVAVPVSPLHPAPEIEYVLSNSQATTFVVHPQFEPAIPRIAHAGGLRLVDTTAAVSSDIRRLPEINFHRRAMILYTSGTTNRPKGVVATHTGIHAQIKTLIDAWEWTANDRTLLVLPLHHIHGIINVLSCAMWAGALCEIHSSFDADRVWERLSSGEVTVFMAVPTIYTKLIAAWEKENPERQALLSDGCSRLRLMVSGSAALPVPILEKWKSISGHTLLERYGMTEIGMALSNPLHGERRPGYVGTPLPGVDVRLVDENGKCVEEGSPGEIEVRGPSVFQEYWNNDEATRNAFRDGWFRTGDIAMVENESYRILGRRSIDIIKTGGYKVSALEIEAALREHPDIADCAVVGIEDPEWGERLCAAIIVRKTLSNKDVREWACRHLAPYKVPTRMLILDSLPRNAMGKVLKPEVKILFR